MIEINFRNLSEPVFSYLYDLFWILLDYIYSKIDLSSVKNFYSQFDYWSILLIHFGVIINFKSIARTALKYLQNLTRKLLSEKNLECVFFGILSLAQSLCKNCYDMIIIFVGFLWYELQNIRNKTDNKIENNVLIERKVPRRKQLDTLKKGIFYSFTFFVFK